MNKLIAGLLIAALPFTTLAQKKTFSHAQIFRGQFPSILQRLPEISGWADDNHYLEVREKNTTLKINAASGISSPYTEVATTNAEPNIQNANNVTLSPDKKLAAFTRNNNLLVKDLTSGKETQLTSDGSDTILNGYASWVYYEEILGRTTNYKAFWWSPDSRQIVFMRFDDSQVPVFPIYFADGQRGFLEQQRYPKAGDKNPEVQIGIVSIEDGKTTWADFDPKNDQYFGTPYWTYNNELLVQWMNREQDSLIVYRVDKKDGSKKEIYTEIQSTWITLDDADRFYFLKSNKGFLIKSDKNGWENVYLHDMNGKLVSQVTDGNFWGTTILAVDETANTVYFKARKDHSARFDVYKASLNGKSVSRLTFGNFSHDEIDMSPNGKYFITTYSNLATPPERALVDNKGKLIRKLGSSKGAEFGQYLLPVSKLITVKSADGKFDLPMTVIYPLNFDSTRRYPVWISVYGGPNAGTVFDRWKPSGGLTQWWAQEGVIQVAMDNRSSGHFGKKGLNDIFTRLGKFEIEDYMTCAKWLAVQPWVDPARIGINGGSFGGYITCMALTYGAEVFTHGIANYSVTDWHLYDTHYTERFMNTPASNKQGYEQTSVLKYLDKYKGKLLIIHGSTDDNVHMQNTIQLIDGLQDRNKNFELMIYPDQRHGISGAKVSHYLLETIRFIYGNLLNKELPKEFEITRKK